jgi:Kef-type K+ transport system membrane component KefB
MITQQLIVNLLLILVIAWILGSIFSRFGLPSMLGQLLAGMILGPPLLGLITSSPSLELISDLGIFFVMFYTGLELDPKKLLEQIWHSLAVALGGFVLPFILGYFTARLFGATVYQSLFVGMGISISAIAVQAVILHSMRISRTFLGHIIIGAAIVDDILSLVAFSVLIGLAQHGSVQIADFFIIILKVTGFFALIIVSGHFLLPKITARLHDRAGKAFTFSIVTALIMAYLAELAGLHFIIGAFLAGQFIRKEIADWKTLDIIGDRFYSISYGFFLPVFFASMSFHLEFSLEWSFMLFTVVLILMATVGKMVGCGLGYMVYRRNISESAIVGFGMNGRGAVELVFATVVIKLSSDMMASGVIAEPLLTQSQFSALVLMAFVTTLLAPFTLKWTVMRTCEPDEKAEFCKLLEESEA